ncbi:MAG: DOPA 4,5-dioxygenase family protein [SAR324 cluster bacterium]|nr:DOPA 4,5-dioxygenase family protein [SAR324 cluster bacterium]
MPIKSLSIIDDYHAHIYYDTQTKSAAAQLRSQLETQFDTVLGRWHDQLVGPHPRWSFQVAFKSELFGKIIPWLALNRNNLVILIHPNTGDDVIDHTDYAIWMGEKMELNLNSLQ